MWNTKNNPKAVKDLHREVYNFAVNALRDKYMETHGCGMHTKHPPKAHVLKVWYSTDGPSHWKMVEF